MLNSNEPSGRTTRRRTRTGDESGSDAAVNFDPDLGLMSFQAQLALAIIESQRQVLENGGYNNGNSNTSNEVGVTEEAKQKWKSYEWGVVHHGEKGEEHDEQQEGEENLKQLARTSSLEAIIERAGGGGGGGLGGSSRDYGSVSTVDLTEDESHHDIEEQKQQMKKNKKKKTSTSLDKISPSKLDGGLLSSFDNNEEPSCSICLCEYEHGERVTKLPCGHIYHETCLNSWTANHFRCPLCNYDLMDGFEQPLSAQQRARQRNLEEQRAFRTMALSTLGRRIRTSRRSSRRTSNRDSIV